MYTHTYLAGTFALGLDADGECHVAGAVHGQHSPAITVHSREAVHGSVVGHHVVAVYLARGCPFHRNKSSLSSLSSSLIIVGILMNVIVSMTISISISVINISISQVS